MSDYKMPTTQVSLPSAASDHVHFWTERLEPFIPRWGWSFVVKSCPCGAQVSGEDLDGNPLPWPAPDPTWKLANITLSEEPAP